MRRSVGAAVLLVLFAASAASAKPGPARAPAPSLTPSPPIAGEAIRIGGIAGGSMRRGVTLQRRVAGSWRTVVQRRSSALGAYGFSLEAPRRTGARVKYRVVVHRTRRYPRRVSRPFVVRTIGQSGELVLPRVAGTGEPIAVTARFTPARNGRVVLLQERRGGRWVERGRTRQDALGVARLVLADLVQGVLELRAVALPQAGAAAAVTATRRLEVAEATPPPPPPPTPPPTTADLLSPEKVVATPTNGGVRLSWTPGSGRDLAAYRVLQATSPDGPWSTVARPGTEAASATLDGLTNGTPYFFRVQAASEAGALANARATAGATPIVVDTVDPVLSSDAREVAPEQILSVEAAERGRTVITLARSFGAVAVGNKLIVPPVGDMPEGMFARVVAVASLSGEALRLELKRASLAEVYENAQVDFDTDVVPQPLPETPGLVIGRSTAGGTARVRMKAPVSAFDCERLNGVPLGREEAWGQQSDVPIVFEIRNFHAAQNFDEREEYLRYTVSADIATTFKVNVPFGVSCELNPRWAAKYRVFHGVVGHIGPIPITADVEPAVRFSVSAGGEIELRRTRRWSVWLEKSRDVPIRFGKDVVDHPLELRATPQVGGSAFAGIHIAILGGGGMGSANAKAGFYIDFGPEFRLTSSPGCAELTMTGRFGLGIELRLWAKRWTKEVGALDLGKAKLATLCHGPPVIQPALRAATIGVFYDRRLRAEDGRTGTWSVAGGDPPAGLVLDPSGRVFGVPAGPPGARRFGVKLIDAAGQTGTAEVTIEVRATPEAVTDLIGRIARRADGQAWYIDKRGARHHVPDGGTYQCLTAQGILVRAAAEADINRFPPYEAAECVRADPGDILRTTDRDAYLLAADRSRQWIPDGGTFDCLVLDGHRTVSAPRYHVMDLAQGTDATCSSPTGARGRVVRADDGSSWYVDLRGDRHWIPDGGVYECLVAQGRRDLGVVVPRRLIGALGTRHEDAECIRAKPGNIIRHADGDAYLLNSGWTRSWIPDGGSYLCLKANGHRLVDRVPRYYVEDLTKSATNATMSCYDAGKVNGRVVRADDGTSYYLDKRGGKHWIPDGGTFQCIEAQAGSWPYTVPRAWLTQKEYEHAKCVRAKPGNLIATINGDAYRINGDWSRSWVPDGGSYLCLEANGHPAIRDVPRYYVEDLVKSPANATMSCYDAAGVVGKAVRASDGTSYYVDKRSSKHWMPDGGTYECIKAQRGAWPHVVPRAWLTQQEHEHAKCVRAQPGNIIRHTDGDAYLLNGDWSRGWIPTGGSYQCFRAEGRALVDAVPRYYLMDLAKGGDANFPTGTCIVRRSNGAAFFVNREGRREWIPDSPTWDCEVGRGIRVFTPGDGLVDGMAETGWHYCLNKANLRGKVLRHHDGDAHFIHGDDTRTWIPDEFTYGCRTRAGTPVVGTRWREYVNAFRETGWDWCFDLNTFRGRYIRHPAGDRHFVGEDGVRHWVPADRAECMNGRFGQPAVVRWRQYITNIGEREWAICGDTLYRNQLMDRGQWLASGNGYRLHMQTDGNLVLYNRSGHAIWAAGAHGGARHLKLHNDGCLARVNHDGHWSWQTGCNRGGDRLVVQSDGNLVLYAGHSAVWATNTVGR
jgi:hypothetical protein